MTIAFSKALGVMMSRGLMSFFRRFRRYFPASSHSSALRGSSAGMEELGGWGGGEGGWGREGGRGGFLRDYIEINLFVRRED